MKLFRSLEPRSFKAKSPFGDALAATVGVAFAILFLLALVSSTPGTFHRRVRVTDCADGGRFGEFAVAATFGRNGEPVWYAGTGGVVNIEHKSASGESVTLRFERSGYKTLVHTFEGSSGRYDLVCLAPEDWSGGSQVVGESRR